MNVSFYIEYYISCYIKYSNLTRLYNPWIFDALGGSFGAHIIKPNVRYSIVSISYNIVTFHAWLTHKLLYDHSLI